MAFTVAGVLREWAGRTPDRPMFTCGDMTVTWAEHHARSSQVAHALQAEGVTAQDRVAFLDKNGLEFFEVAFGTAEINAVLVAVNWRLAAAEMATVINDAEARVLIVGHQFLGELAAFQHELTSVKQIVVIDGGGSFDRLADGHRHYRDWLAGRSSEDPGVVAGPDDVAMQLYTSGTTGLPKGAMLTNANLAAPIHECSREMQLEAGSVSMVAMPLFHIGGSGWALFGITNGAHSVIMREVDPVAMLEAFERHRVTHVFIVPAVLMMLLASPEATTRDLSHLRYLVYGASPISDKVLTQALSTFGCDFIQLYGMTETTGAITLLRPEEHDPEGAHPERLRSCGKPFSHVALRVVDLSSEADQPAGRPGELWTRSAQNMKGYWRNPAATAATITPDGWLKTGDVAYMDGDGFVYLHDRVKDMIISGGENIYPAEVENVLMAHPAVADVAVIGVPDDHWGEAVKAVVVPSPGADLDGHQLIEFARSRIGHYKAPRSVDVVETLPRNPSGKVLKRELREPYWKDTDRRIH